MVDDYMPNELNGEDDIPNHLKLLIGWELEHEQSSSKLVKELLNEAVVHLKRGLELLNHAQRITNAMKVHHEIVNEGVMNWDQRP